ncbi:MAG: tRNA (N6-isopentenyl adenosine(37)-C2)-methylthiotransferase MiaB [Parcubacteria group bacterium]|nr:tRNA (N6-isopentenyl adenosine(37)-C2)-methylthiotransferase MiaB [Parcubacteria group bacterium]
MKYFIKTFGCQMNKSDSERIASILENLKYEEVKNINKAQLVILNTCSVRDSAESRVLGLIRNLKKKHKNIKIGVTGCMIHIRPDKLEKNTDFLFDIKNLSNLKNLLIKYRQVSNLSQPTSSPSQQKTKDYFKINPIYQSNFHAYVPIMTGCNNFCTYCVVPYARDREKSRAAKNIIEEVENLVKKGYKAITLLGQNVNSYGNDLKNEIKFPELLQKLAKIDSAFWIWFVTSHPKDMSDKLIEVVASNNKICNYVHLPVQAGSNKILKAMNRGYTKEKYLKLVQNIRGKIKNVSLSTDIIIGFPGETSKDFNNTINIFKSAKFDMAYICRYSPRPKTVAFKLENNVSDLEKKRRDKVLTKLLEKYSLEFNKKLIGKTVDVLIENKGKNNTYIGKTKTSKTVRISSEKPASKLIGEIIKVKIKKADNANLEGKLL